MVGAASAAQDAAVWTDDAGGARRVHLYFFWSAACPHCWEARPFVEALPGRYPWLVLHSADVTADAAAAAQYAQMAAALGGEARSVPAFLFCRRMQVGFGDAQTTGLALEDALRQCHDGTAGLAAPAVELPWLGSVTPERFSLPALTLIIAGLDAFNPCAFFVLLFLLSLLTHAGSRTRMLFVGGTFVFVSGFVYFLFMAAWLNVFRWLGELAAVTTAAGVLAVAVALANVRDYFRRGGEVALGIPAGAKPGLYRRMRGLLRADSLPTLTLGTIVLAVAANTYELLCTAGFPMVYTRLLTLAKLPTAAYYGYLVFYNVVYVLPLLAIAVAFAATLGARKLSEAEGRLLKLVSGLMMLGLGVLLVATPGALASPWIAAALLGGAVGAAWLVERRRHRS